MDESGERIISTSDVEQTEEGVTGRAVISPAKGIPAS